MSRKIEPNIAKKSNVMPALAALNRGLRNSEVSSIGWGLYDSHHANAASTIAATVNKPRMVGSVQPCSGAWMIA